MAKSKNAVSDIGEDIYDNNFLLTYEGMLKEIIKNLSPSSMAFTVQATTVLLTEEQTIAEKINVVKERVERVKIYGRFPL